MAETREGVCVIHCEVERRYEDRHKAQDRINSEQVKTNDELFTKLNLMNGKLNWILGGVAVGWPLLLLVFHLLEQRIRP